MMCHVLTIAVVMSWGNWLAGVAGSSGAYHSREISLCFVFPTLNLHDGKLRPALMLGKLPGSYGNWLIRDGFVPNTTVGARF